MPKINVMLEESTHDVLIDYKRKHKYPSLDVTLNEYIKETEGRKQLFRKV